MTFKTNRFSPLAGGILAACLGVFAAAPAGAAQVNVSVQTVPQLNDAIATAEANPNNSYLITMWSGTYMLTKSFTLTKAKIELKGTISTPWIHNLDAKNIKQRIFTLKPAAGYTTRLWLTGVDLKNGESGGSGGGCIFSDNSEVVVSHSVVENCVSALAGSGIYAYGGTLNIFQSQIKNNKNIFYSSGGGGAQASGGGVYVNGKTRLDVTRSTFSGNVSVRGGALMVDGSSSLTMVNSTISGNTAIRGGGLMIRGTGNVRLEFNTIYNNKAGLITGDEPRVGGGLLFSSYQGLLGFYGNIVAGNDTWITDPEFYATEGDDVYIDHPEVGRWGESKYYTNVIGKLDATAEWRLGHFQVFGIGGQTWPYDPKLGILTTNGSGYGAAIPNHKPLAASSVRGAYFRDYGPGNTVGGKGIPCAAQDGRGFNRKSAPSVCDVGAIDASTN